MRIYLIGMPFSGKTTIGKALSKALNMDLIDIDAAIVKKQNCGVADIFATHGESFFRALEKKTLEESLKYENVIISTGGGVVKDVSNRELMDGIIIYLRNDIKTLEKRSNDKKGKVGRPLLVSTTLDKLLEERDEFYRYFMHYAIDNNNIEKTVHKIEEIIREPKKKILVINGPNLNMLGKRPKEIYGSLTLEEINKQIINDKAFQFVFFHSNHEGSIIDAVQTYYGYSGIIINPGAYTHTSIAIRDALEIALCPKVEVHLSSVNNREDFRKVNYITDVVDVAFSGEFERSYLKAIDYLKRVLNIV